LSLSSLFSSPATSPSSLYTLSLHDALPISTFTPDHVVVADFNQIYVSRSAADFLAELQLLRPCELIVGEDFRFGSCKGGTAQLLDRKSTRLNSSHVSISYAVFCLKKKTTRI